MSKPSNPESMFEAFEPAAAVGPAALPNADLETALTWLESVLQGRTGQPLNDLQRIILRFCLAGRKEGKKYLDIANAYGCTEGHAKDVGAQLWRSLSQALGEKVTKQNLRTAVAHCRSKAHQKARSLKSRLARLDPAAPQMYRWSWDEHWSTDECLPHAGS